MRAANVEHPKKPPRFKLHMLASFTYVVTLDDIDGEWRNEVNAGKGNLRLLHFRLLFILDEDVLN